MSIRPDRVTAAFDLAGEAEFVAYVRRGGFDCLIWAETTLDADDTAERVAMLLKDMVAGEPVVDPARPEISSITYTQKNAA